MADESPLERRVVDDEGEVDALLATTSGASSKHSHCVGRCRAGRCTVSHKAKHCCLAPRHADSYEEYAASLQGANNGGHDDDKKSDGKKKWHCWE